MDPPYLHLLINHFPIVLSLLGAAGILAAVLTRKMFFWLFAMTCLVLAGLLVVPTYLSGLAAGDVMIKRWFVARDAVHAHEESGELTLWLVLIAGASSAVALARLYRSTSDMQVRFPYWLRALVGVTAVVAAWALTRTALLGGEIVHGAKALEAAPAGYVAPAAERKP